MANIGEIAEMVREANRLLDGAPAYEAGETWSEVRPQMEAARHHITQAVGILATLNGDVITTLGAQTIEVQTTTDDARIRYADATQGAAGSSVPLINTLLSKSTNGSDAGHKSLRAAGVIQDKLADVIETLQSQEVELVLMEDISTAGKTASDKAYEWNRGTIEAGEELIWHLTGENG